TIIRSDPACPLKLLSWLRASGKRRKFTPCRDGVGNALEPYTEGTVATAQRGGRFVKFPQQGIDTGKTVCDYASPARGDSRWQTIRRESNSSGWVLPLRAG